MIIQRENAAVLRQDPSLQTFEERDLALPLLHRVRAVAAGAFWFAAGTAVIVYGAALVYTNVLRVEADSAIVAGTVEALQAPAAGRLVSELRVGAEFVRGDRLYSVTDPELEERVGLASVRVERARSDLQQKRAELEAERARRDNYLVSLRADLARTRSEFAALRELERNAQTRFETTQGLYTKGYVTRLRLEDVSDRAAETRANVLRARSTEGEKLALLAAVEAGRGYAGLGGLGRMEDYIAAVERAEAEVRLAAEEMRVLMDRRAETKIAASSSGRVVRVMKLDGASLRSGDTVALFQRGNDRVVYAFLTQAEVGHVSIDDEAEVYLPAQRVTATARVSAVERSGGYLDDVESRYLWRLARDTGVRHTDRDRTARVTLRFRSADQPVAEARLDPGTPAVVSFRKNWDNSGLFPKYASLESLTNTLDLTLKSVMRAGDEALVRAR